MIKISKITQKKLNVIQPLTDVIIYQYKSEIKNEAGYPIVSYETTNSQARESVVSDEIAKNLWQNIYNNLNQKIDKSTIIKSFYFNNDFVNTLNRQLQIGSDYIVTKPNNLLYRVVEVRESFNTDWKHIIAVQTNDFERRYDGTKEDSRPANKIIDI